MFKKLPPFIILLLLIFSCTEKIPDQYDLLLTNVRVIDVGNDHTSELMRIGVRADTIAMVRPMREPGEVIADQKHDGNGKYLLPGLWDMHVHLRGGDSLTEENKALLRMFLSHGITTIRDAGGDITPAVMQWKKAITLGELQGPQIFTSGPKLDGENPAWPGSLKVTDPTSAAVALDSLENIGADYVKIYDGSLNADVYYELIRQVEERGLKVTGHMPMNADLLRAYSLGLDGIEHLYYLLGVSSRKGDSIRLLQRGYASLPDLIDTYDRETSLQAFKILADREFYVTPTLHIGEVLKDLKTENHLNDSLLSHMGAGIRKTYARREAGAKKRTETQQETVEKQFQLFKDLVKPMQDSGIILLAGSDCGAFNSYVYPGASLQEELILLTSAGLRPAEALATSIINGPRFFGLNAHYGEISVGKKAHMILLTENPLENIEAIRTIEMVIKGTGTYKIK